MTDCDNCIDAPVCTYARIERKRRGRPRKVVSIEPPTLPQYTDGRYRLRRTRSLLVPVELDVEQEFSGSYRAWVRGVLSQ